MFTDSYVHWSLWPVASLVIRDSSIVCVISSIVLFSNHRPHMESYRVSQVIETHEVFIERIIDKEWKWSGLSGYRYIREQKR